MSSTNSSESMGRDEDDEIIEVIPMKQPATTNETETANNGEADESFLDDDFLSFSNVDNGGTAELGSDEQNDMEKLSGKKRERSLSPAMPSNDQYRYNAQQNKPPVIIPWINNTATSSAPPPQQQQWGRNNNNNRGYGNNNNYQNQPGSYNNNNQPRNNNNIPSIIKLHNEIISFVNLMSPTSQELELRTKMVTRVTNLAYKIFGGSTKVQVLPFGSQVTGLCLPGSDIDFVIRFIPTTSNNKNGKKTKKSSGGEKEEDGEEDYTIGNNPLHLFANAVKDEFGIRSELQDDEEEFASAKKKLNNNGEDNDDDDSDKDEEDEGSDEDEHLSYLEVIEQTRVPLVKFTVAPYNIDIDVCFDQPNGPESAELMHRFMESMPPLRPLTFVLKYFLASRDINKPFTGGIGSYLLQMMIVSFLQHRVRDDMARDCGSSGRYYNLGSLLLDFFEFYGIDFNYVTTGISVRHDGYYFAKGQRDMKAVFWQPSRPCSLAMENPLDPSTDVGAGAFRMQMIKRIFEHAYKTLLAYVSEPMEPTDSILATIIPPTEEMERRMILKKDMKVQEAERILNGNGSNHPRFQPPTKRRAETPKDTKKRKKEQKKQKKNQAKWQRKEEKKERKREVKAKRKEAKQARKAEQQLRRNSSGSANSNQKGNKKAKLQSNDSNHPTHSLD